MEGKLNCTGGWGFQLPFVTSRRPEEHLELEDLAPRGITDGVCWNILLPLRVSHNKGPLMCLFLFIFSFLLWCKITMMCEASSAGGTRSWATTRVLWRRWYVKGNITATSQLAAAVKAGDVTTTQKIKRVLVGGCGGVGNHKNPAWYPISITSSLRTTAESNWRINLWVGLVPNTPQTSTHRLCAGRL